MVVWGSSLGWHCFFAALDLGVPCIGFDLLSSQVARATSIYAELGDGRSGMGTPAPVAFVHGDALSADYALGPNARVLWINDYAWSPVVRRRAMRKAAKELPPGGILVCFRPLPGGGEDEEEKEGEEEEEEEANYTLGHQVQTAGGGLRLVATVPVAVTWNAGQDVLVYVREQLV